MSFTALIPGLRVSVKGLHDEKGQLVADVINFSGEDLKTAEAIQAGLTPTQQGVESNKQAANKVQILTIAKESATSKRYRMSRSVSTI